MDLDKLYKDGLQISHGNGLQSVYQHGYDEGVASIPVVDGTALNSPTEVNLSLDDKSTEEDTPLFVAPETAIDVVNSDNLEASTLVSDQTPQDSVAKS